MKAAEEWRPIARAEGKYEVSDRGRVRRVRRTTQRVNGGVSTYDSMIMKTTPNAKHGYRVVRLFGTTYYVHQLVLEAFVGPRPEGMVCRHLDGDRTNAALPNLAWGTPSENNLDRVVHGTDPNARRRECVHGHPLVSPNLVLKTLKERGHRSCLACARARSRIHSARLRGIELDMQAVSDKCFEALGTSQAPAKRTRCPQGHRLASPNLEPHQLKLGARSCRACARARSRIQNQIWRGRVSLLKFRPMADQFYERFRPAEEEAA